MGGTMGDLKLCPHCGYEPEVDTAGTCIEIHCCSSMGIQKCDHLNEEDRDTWNHREMKYSTEAEAKAFSVIAERWNKRTKEGDTSNLSNCISCDDRKVEDDKLVCTDCFYSYAPNSKEQLKIRKACQSLKVK